MKGDKRAASSGRGDARSASQGSPGRTPKQSAAASKLGDSASVSNRSSSLSRVAQENASGARDAKSSPCSTRSNTPTQGRVASSKRDDSPRSVTSIRSNSQSPARPAGCIKGHESRKDKSKGTLSKKSANARTVSGGSSHRSYSGGGGDDRATGSSTHPSELQAGDDMGQPSELEESSNVGTQTSTGTVRRNAKGDQSPPTPSPKGSRKKKTKACSTVSTGDTDVHAVPTDSDLADGTHSKKLDGGKKASGKSRKKTEISKPVDQFTSPSVDRDHNYFATPGIKMPIDVVEEPKKSKGHLKGAVKRASGDKSPASARRKKLAGSPKSSASPKGNKRQTSNTLEGNDGKQISQMLAGNPKQDNSKIQDVQHVQEESFGMLTEHSPIGDTLTPKATVKKKERTKTPKVTDKKERPKTPKGMVRKGGPGRPKGSLNKESAKSPKGIVKKGSTKTPKAHDSTEAVKTQTVTDMSGDVKEIIQTLKEGVKKGKTKTPKGNKKQDNDMLSPSKLSSQNKTVKRHKIIPKIEGADWYDDETPVPKKSIGLPKDAKEVRELPFQNCDIFEGGDEAPNETGSSEPVKPNKIRSKGRKSMAQGVDHLNLKQYSVVKTSMGDVKADVKPLLGDVKSPVRGRSKKKVILSAGQAQFGASESTVTLSVSSPGMLKPGNPVSEDCTEIPVFQNDREEEWPSDIESAKKGSTGRNRKKSNIAMPTSNRDDLVNLAVTSSQGGTSAMHMKPVEQIDKDSPRSRSRLRKGAPTCIEPVGTVGKLESEVAFVPEEISESLISDSAKKEETSDIINMADTKPPENVLKESKIAAEQSNPEARVLLKKLGSRRSSTASSGSKDVELGKVTGELSVDADASLDKPGHMLELAHSEGEQGDLDSSGSSQTIMNIFKQTIALRQKLAKERQRWQMPEDEMSATGSVDGSVGSGKIPGGRNVFEVFSPPDSGAESDGEKLSKLRGRPPSRRASSLAAHNPLTSGMENTDNTDDSHKTTELKETAKFGRRSSTTRSVNDFLQAEPTAQDEEQPMGHLDNNDESAIEQTTDRHFRIQKEDQSIVDDVSNSQDSVLNDHIDAQSKTTFRGTTKRSTRSLSALDIQSHPVGKDSSLLKTEVTKQVGNLADRTERPVTSECEKSVLTSDVSTKRKMVKKSTQSGAVKKRYPKKRDDYKKRIRFTKKKKVPTATLR